MQKTLTIVFAAIKKARGVVQTNRIDKIGARSAALRKELLE
jgi:hypothetical protein